MNFARVDWNRVLVVELSVLVGLVLLYITGHALERISHFLTLVAVSAIIAFIVDPAVGRLHRSLGHRIAATGIVYVGVLVVAGVGLSLVAGPLIREAAAFARELPGYIARIPEWSAQLESFASGWGIRLQLTDLVSQATAQAQAAGAVVLSGTLSAAGGLSSALADVALAIVISFYLSVDGPRLRASLYERIPGERRTSAARVEESVRRVLSAYVRGQVILGVTIGLFAGVGAMIFGLPYPVVLGVLAGVFELIPMFGAILAAVPALITAVFQPFPTVLWVGLYFLAISQAESYLLAPRITGGSLGLPPLAVLFALLLGVELAGFVGALVAVPLAAVIVDLSRPIATLPPPASESLPESP